MEKILISGTGRCGTTFLIKIFSFLEFDTGFTKENYRNFIYNLGNCKEGMESHHSINRYIIKSPHYLEYINKILKEVKIKMFIIPVRNFNDSAESRVKNKEYDKGGLWNARNKEEQITYYHKIISEYILLIAKHEIPTLFLDFDKMISDKVYLFNKLNVILSEKNITFEQFASVYDNASESSAPRSN